MFLMTVFNKATLEIGHAYMCSSSEQMAIQEVPEGHDVLVGEFVTAATSKVALVDGKHVIVPKTEAELAAEVEEMRLLKAAERKANPGTDPGTNEDSSQFEIAISDQVKQLQDRIATLENA